METQEAPRREPGVRFRGGGRFDSKKGFVINQTRQVEKRIKERNPFASGDRWPHLSSTKAFVETCNEHN